MCCFSANPSSIKELSQSDSTIKIQLSVFV